MDDEDGRKPSRVAFELLVFGYFVTAIATVYGIGATLPVGDEGASPSEYSVIQFFTMLGFVIVVYSQIRYLNETDRLRWLERSIGRITLKRVLALVFALILALTYINAVLTNYDFYQPDNPELGSIVILTLTLVFISIGILIFNISFTLLGPVYILLFYFLVVKGERKVSKPQRDVSMETPELPKIATTFDEEAEEATVRVRHPATADALEIRVNDEVRETIENPKQDDAVTVAKKPEENLEVEEKGGN